MSAQVVRRLPFHQPSAHLLGAQNHGHNYAGHHRSRHRSTEGRHCRAPSCSGSRQEASRRRSRASGCKHLRRPAAGRATLGPVSRPDAGDRCSAARDWAIRRPARLRSSGSVLLISSMVSSIWSGAFIDPLLMQRLIVTTAGSPACMSMVTPTTCLESTPSAASTDKPRSRPSRMRCSACGVFSAMGHPFRLGAGDVDCRRWLGHCDAEKDVGIGQLDRRRDSARQPVLHALGPALFPEVQHVGYLRGSAECLDQHAIRFKCAHGVRLNTAFKQKSNATFNNNLFTTQTIRACTTR